MIGETLQHYKIETRIGGGGMGVIYRAHDTKLDRAVALKFLTDGRADAKHQERLMREARASSALHHSNICTIYDVAQTRDGRLFIVMHYCDGGPLKDRIARGPMPVSEAVDIAMQAARGLAHAHAHGIVHRDIKPGNVMLANDGTVKIVDFGIATRPAGNTSELAGTVVGTAAYMSPEQARGEPVDARTDVWSLGAVLYEMLTGRPPFVADYPLALMYLICCEEPVPVMERRPDVPPALCLFTSATLTKDLGTRVPSMDAFMAGLQAAVEPAAPAIAPAVAPARHSAADRLAEARAASERLEFTAAFDTYSQLDADQTLDPDDLMDYAVVAELVSKPAVMRDAWERAHAAYVKANRVVDAARAAAHIGDHQFDRGALAVANGWLKRAETLLRDQPRSIAHGYIARARARMALEEHGDLDTAERFAHETIAVGEQFGDADLVALGRQDLGRVLVRRERYAEGLELLDEGMTAAIAGELSPIVVGKAYCNMISTCQRIGDYRRASEWSRQQVQWCGPFSDSPFPGVCSVHRAEVMRARGAWAEAEVQAARAVAAHSEWDLSTAARAHYVVGEIQLQRHRLEAAEESFRKAHELRRAPMPGLAVLRLRQGRVDAARALIERALMEGSSHTLDRVRLLPAAVEILLAAGDVDAAHTRARELTTIANGLGSPLFAGQAAHATGAVALAQGGHDDALQALRRALEHWKQAEMPHEEACTRVLLARVYWGAGESDHAELEARTARSVFEQLGAPTEAAQVDDLLRAHGADAGERGVSA